MLDVNNTPQVSIFFIEETEDGFRLYGKNCNLLDGRLELGILRFPDSHCVIWVDVKDENPAWQKKRYLEIPRGRVDANNGVNPIFTVVLPLKYRGNQELTAKVAQEYHLPKDSMKCRYEELY